MAFLQEFKAPIDDILCQEDKTSVVLNESNLGCGCLYITKSRVSWLNEAGLGFAMEYPRISLHAISRDLNSFPKPCLYVMFDGSLDGDEGNSDEEEDDEKITEIRFVPENTTSLELLYHAMSDGSALHPDPDDSLSDDDDENYMPQTGNGGYIKVESADDDEEEDVSNEMAVDDTVDASQFENADEDDAM